MINTKVKKPIELVSFHGCKSAFMRMPWATNVDWYELSNDIGSWVLVTGICRDELEAYWYAEKAGY
jgi:hypothetical protein|tara:strand:- start:590 stop:787 length:198 start_codon:yes stop_codon:yes gene_type:complete